MSHVVCSQHSPCPWAPSSRPLTPPRASAFVCASPTPGGEAEVGRGRGTRHGGASLGGRAPSGTHPWDGRSCRRGFAPSGLPPVVAGAFWGRPPRERTPLLVPCSAGAPEVPSAQGGEEVLGVCRCVRGKTSRTLGSGDPGLATHAPEVIGSYANFLSLGFLTREAGCHGDNLRASTPAILPEARVPLPVRGRGLSRAHPGGRVPSLLPSQPAGPREKRPRPRRRPPGRPRSVLAASTLQEKRCFPPRRSAFPWSAESPARAAFLPRRREAATPTPDPATRLLTPLSQELGYGRISPPSFLVLCFSASCAVENAVALKTKLIF